MRLALYKLFCRQARYLQCYYALTAVLTQSLLDFLGHKLLRDVWYVVWPFIAPQVPKSTLPPLVSTGSAPAVSAAPAAGGDAILSQIAEQGNVVRDLKSKKAGKDEVKAAVDQLLAFKKQYKDLTGVDAPVGGKPAAKAAPAPVATSGNGDAILGKIAEQGNVVRDLKAKKAGKDEVTAAVQLLLKHKADYKALTGIVTT